MNNYIEFDFNLGDKVSWDRGMYDEDPLKPKVGVITGATRSTSGSGWDYVIHCPEVYSKNYPFTSFVIPGMYVSLIERCI